MRVMQRTFVREKRLGTGREEGFSCEAVVVTDSGRHVFRDVVRATCLGTTEGSEKCGCGSWEAGGARL